jgi:hypothetical protein
VRLANYPSLVSVVFPVANQGSFWETCGNKCVRVRGSPRVFVAIVAELVTQTLVWTGPLDGCTDRVGFVVAGRPVRAVSGHGISRSNAVSACCQLTTKWFALLMRPIDVGLLSVVWRRWLRGGRACGSAAPGCCPASAVMSGDEDPAWSCHPARLAGADRELWPGGVGER